MGAIVSGNPWIIFEFLVFLVLATMILGYADFDRDLKLVTRGFIVFTLWIFVIGGAHVLAVARNLGNPIDWKLAYSFIGLRAIFVALFLCWMYSRNLL